MTLNVGDRVKVIRVTSSAKTHQDRSLFVGQTGQIEAIDGPFITVVFSTGLWEVFFPEELEQDSSTIDSQPA